MEIIFDAVEPMTISVESVSLSKHVIAGVDRAGHVVLMRRHDYHEEASFEAIVLTQYSNCIANSYSGSSGNSTVRDILGIDGITWHAFDSVRDFFRWAAEVADE